MNIIATAVKQLIAAGITGDALVTAIDQLEDAQKPRLSKGAIRTRKWRARHSDVTETDERHGDVTSVTCDVNGSNSKEERVSPIREESKEVSKKESKKEPRKIKTRLPSDWVPSESLLSYGREQGLSADQVSRAVENLRIWARSTGELKADWSATLQGFFRRDAEKLGGSAPSLSLVMPEHGQVHAGRVYLRRETPQFEAWAEHTGKAVTDKHGGWWFNSEWPPEMAESTGRVVRS